jgi:hypothetical protein
MTDRIGEAVREAALGALRKRIEALGKKVAWGTATTEKDGRKTVVLTSEAAHAAHTRADFIEIARDVETMELSS